MSIEKRTYAPENATGAGRRVRMRLWKNALWLAGWEARKNWITHSWMAAIMLLLGLAVALLFGVTLGTNESPGESFASGFSAGILLVGIIFLAPNNSAWIPRKQTRKGFFSDDGHLVFLLSLPMSVREVMLGRALTMVISVLALSCLAFTPSYLLSEPLRTQLGVEQYLLFVGFWVGFSLVIAGFSLFTELGLGGKAGVIIHVTAIFLLGFLAAFLSGGVDFNYLRESVELVQDHGPLPTAMSLLIGVAALVLSAGATTWRLHRRDLSA